MSDYSFLYLLQITFWIWKNGLAYRYCLHSGLWNLPRMHEYSVRHFISSIRANIKVITITEWFYSIVYLYFLLGCNKTILLLQDYIKRKISVIQSKRRAIYIVKSNEDFLWYFVSVKTCCSFIMNTLTNIKLIK